MTLTTAARHSTRLETLGRTVKHYIPHSLTSFPSLSTPHGPHGPLGPLGPHGTSTSPQSARPVSFGHYTLPGPQAPKFGQLLDEDGVPPVEKDDIIHAAWYDALGRWVTLLLLHFRSYTC